jgi:hypothetical protein
LWSAVEHSGDITLHWLTYEDFMIDKPAAVCDICAFCGIKADLEAAKEVIDRLEGKKEKYNFNVGKVGRGGELLNDEQKARLMKYASYYPGVDFTRIGL